MSNGTIDEGRFQLDVTIMAVKVLTSKGVNKAAAVVVAAEIAKEVCRLNAGRSIYIPNNRAEQHIARAAKVIAEFNGENYGELAAKHGLSERHVYNLVKRHEEQAAGAFKLVPEMLPCLPDRFRQVVEVIGLHKAGVLIGKLSGRQIYIAKGMGKNRSLLIRAIGKSTTDKLLAGFDNILLHIPSIAMLRRQYENIEIRQRVVSGESIDVLADEYGVTPRRIRQIAKEHR